MKKLIIIFMALMSSFASADDNVHPCDTSNPDHPYNQSVLPPGFSCKPGYALDPVCAQLCLDQFYLDVFNAQVAAANAVDAACSQYASDATDCDTALGDCLDEPDPDIAACSAEATRCYDFAQNVYEAGLEMTDSIYQFALAKARRDYIACIRNCCYPQEMMARTFFMIEEEPGPCDTTHENHLCNADIQPPFFTCATGELNPVCAALCRLTFKESVDAARDAACAAITAACTQRVADIDECDQDLADCLDAPDADPAVCAARSEQCYEDALEIFDLSVSAAETNFALAVSQAQQAYKKCMRLCCEDN